MARIRTVKPDFWGNAKTAKVSRDARLLFLGLLNLADDEGRLLSSPKTIAGNVFPHDDDVQPNDITAWIGELVDARFVQLYMVDGIGYCEIIGFAEHQRVPHPTPSKYPPPSSGNVRESFAKSSGGVRETFSPEVEVEVEVEKPPSAPPASKSTAAVDVPASSPPATDYVKTVFDAWLESTGRTNRTVLDSSRRRTITKALKSYPLDDVLDAVRGWKHSPHHRGENDRQTVYNELDMLLRNAGQIEKFRDLERGNGCSASSSGFTSLL